MQGNQKMRRESNQCKSAKTANNSKNSRMQGNQKMRKEF